MAFEPPIDALQPRLQTCGLAAQDTLILLSRVAEGTSFDRLSGEIGSGLLLRKRSPSGRKQMLAAARIRYAQAPAPLPRLPALAAALQHFGSPMARNQVLLPYLLLADRAAYEIVVHDVLPRLRAGTGLATADIIASLDALLARHGKAPWSDSLRKRWAQGLLSVLRDVGALGRGRERETVLPYMLWPEVFCFHLWGLWDHGLRGAALHESGFWRLLLLHEGEARALVGTLSERGWWKFTSVAGTDEIVPVFDSAMEWLSVGLG